MAPGTLRTGRPDAQAWARLRAGCFRFRTRFAFFAGGDAGREPARA